LERIWKVVAIAKFRYYLVIFLEKLRKSMKHRRVAGVLAEI
jgi:hypothetical protein